MNIRKFFGLEEFILTADVANRTSRYGTSKPFSEVVRIKIKDVEEQIKAKLNYSPNEKLLALIVIPGQKPLFEAVRQEFLTRGFKAFYVSKEQIDDLGENIYLFISWDIEPTDNVEVEENEYEE